MYTERITSPERHIQLNSMLLPCTIPFSTTWHARNHHLECKLPSEFQLSVRYHFTNSFELICSYHIHDIQISHTWSWSTRKWSTKQLALLRTPKTKSSSNRIFHTKRMRLAGQHMQLNSMILPSMPVLPGILVKNYLACKNYPMSHPWSTNRSN